MQVHKWRRMALSMCLAIGTGMGAAAPLVRGQDAAQTAPADRGQAESQDNLHIPAQVLAELRSEMQALHSQLSELQSEARAARADAADLRQQLALTRAQLAASGGSIASGAQTAVASYATKAPVQLRPAAQYGQSDRLTATADESQQMVDSKINDLYQTKVESGSKYRVRLSGIALLGMFNNRGTVDSQDVPQVALPRDPYGSQSSLGASLRQSQIGLEAFGPDLLGAHTSASVKFDFSGGQVDTPNGAFQGLVRLRTGTIRLDWAQTSIVAGQDYLFFSPLAPSSLASLAVPALSYSGNLWAWGPQVRVEHRIPLSDDSSVLLEGGVLDSLSGDVPFSYERGPTWGEQSGYPAFAGRVAYAHRMFGQNLTAGMGAFFGRQNWALGRKVNGWAGMADLSLPLGTKFTVSSAFYRGSAVGGLGGGIGQSVLFSGSLLDPTVMVKGLDAVGGWVQVQFRPAPKWQINGAWGEDSPFAAEMRPFSGTTSYYGPLLSKNMSALANFIYRVRSDVLFSAEYRRLRTTVLDGGTNSANIINMVLGYEF